MLCNMTALAFVWVLFLISLVFWQSWIFDQLIKREYYLYYECWKRDGKPIGFLWIPPEVKVLGGLAARPGSIFAFQKLTFIWTFRTPQWMRDDGEALRLLRRYRILNVVWYVAFIATLILLQLLS
jgi:hypothetical protein